VVLGTQFYSVSPLPLHFDAHEEILARLGAPENFREGQ